MEKVVTSTELQKHTRDIIDMARTQDMVIVIETYGKPMAVMLPYDEYQAYLAFKQRQHDERRERFAQVRELAALNAAVTGLSDSEAAILVEEARETVYQRRDVDGKV